MWGTRSTPSKLGACPSNFGPSCERPPRSLRSRLPLTRGRLTTLPLVRGRRRRRRRGGRSRTQFRITQTGSSVRLIRLFKQRRSPHPLALEEYIRDPPGPAHVGQWISIDEDQICVVSLRYLPDAIGGAEQLRGI